MNCVICNNELDPILDGQNAFDEIIPDAYICRSCFIQKTKYQRAAERGDVTAFDKCKAEFRKSMYGSLMPLKTKEKVLMYLNALDNICLAAADKNHEEAEIRSRFLCTTGSHLEGYRISSYMGVISAESVMDPSDWNSRVNFWETDVMETAGDDMENSLDALQSKALDHLLQKAVEKGGDAIVGLTLDLKMLGGNIVTAVASGTLVKVNRI